MKKILLVAMTLLISASVAFGMIGETADLPDLYGKNMLRIAGDGGYYKGGTGVLFGTEQLRFSITIKELNSFFNNADVKSDTTMPVIEGLPRFFIGAGYNMGDHKIALGYGLTKKWDATSAGPAGTDKPGWMGNEIGAFYQGQFGATRIRAYIPVEFGMGTGKNWQQATNEKDGGPTVSHLYDLKDVSGIKIQPQVRWYGNIGKLTQIRFAVPYSAYTKKAESATDAEKAGATGDYKVLESKNSAIGADLRAYFTMATDPVIINLIPRVQYYTAMKGNQLITSPMGREKVGHNSSVDIAPIKIKNYKFERPWQLNFQFMASFEAGNDFLALEVYPYINWSTTGAPKITFVDGGVEKIRKEPISSLGYGMELILGFKITPNLTANIGLIAEGVTTDVTTAGTVTGTTGNGAPANTAINGRVTWYF